LTDAQFAGVQKPPPKFYWVTPSFTPSTPSATYTVAYTYAQSAPVEASFLVEGPAPSAAGAPLIATALPGTINVVPILLPNGSSVQFLGLVGTPPLYADGIEFTPSAALPADYSGQYEWDN
jgi:hypothetical protein